MIARVGMLLLVQDRGDAESEARHAGVLARKGWELRRIAAAKGGIDAR